MALILLIQLVIITETVTANLHCLQCTESVSPTDCDTVTLCGSHERCYTDTFVNAAGSIRYNQGCRDAQQCGTALAANGKREITYNSSDIPHASNVNDNEDTTHEFVYVGPNTSAKLHSSFYKRSSGLLICNECCIGSLCNSAGCGSKGYISPRGPICYNCAEQNTTDDCSKITVCGQDEKCEAEVEQFKQLLIIGRRRSSLQTGGSCNIQCCKTDLCNTNCSHTSSSTSPLTQSPVVTLARFTLAPTKTSTMPAFLDPCLSNPCMQGMCSVYQNSYRCTCKDGFWGRNCDKVSIAKATTPSTQAITFLPTSTATVMSSQGHASVQGSNPCISNPCVGGSCSVYLSTYTCSCITGYWGRNCEKGGPVTQQLAVTNPLVTLQPFVSDLCLPNPCVRGICTSYLKTFTCQCDVGFSGPTCSQALSTVWPCGTYGLMRTVQGCPDYTHFLEGWRTQDTEDSFSSSGGNAVSAGIQDFLAGEFKRTVITTGFCIKSTQESMNCLNHRWPKGAYCILKHGTCPEGFGAGYVFWDDEDVVNNNKFNGTMPNGVYNINTRIFYCCRNDRDPDTAVLLPNRRPFVLIRYGQKCQLVYKMTVRDLFIAWDDENISNKSADGGMHPNDDKEGGRDHVLHFCYYSPTI